MRIATLAATLALVISSTFAKAAEIKVISANGVRALLADLKAEFEKDSGHTLAITIVETGTIRKRIASGEVFDVVIVPTTTSAEMTKQQQLVAGSSVEIAKTSFGFAFRQGEPLPDVSTSDALKTTLLNAKSILITDPASGGISGVHLMEVLDKLGITEAMRPKLNINRGNSYHAERVVKGEADFAIQAEHEIKCVKGAAFVDYPPEFRRAIVFAAAIATASKEPSAGKSYIQFLAGPAASTVVRSKCLSVP